MSKVEWALSNGTIVVHSSDFVLGRIGVVSVGCCHSWVVLIVRGDGSRWRLSGLVQIVSTQQRD